MALRLAKLTRPVVGTAISRERLFTRLDAARHRPLILVNGPAGAGKTTLVSSYVEARGCPCLWYQVDAGDKDVASFFHYLGQAFKQVTGGRKTMPVLSPEYRKGLGQFARKFFRELFEHLDDSVLLVLDNFQDLESDAELYTLLAQACEDIPQGSSLVMITRSGLPQAFSRSRACGQIAEISWGDLQFNLEEQLAIVRHRQPQAKISRRHILRIDRQVRGWVAGLVLLLEQEGEPWSTVLDIDLDGDEEGRQYLFDYFASEIFSGIDSRFREFLIRTAILPTMTASICRELTGNRRAGKILSELAQKQYFTLRRGSINPGYEYHPLFRQFLLREAHARLGESECRQLQKRAGMLLADAGNIDNAVALLIEAQDWSALGVLILRHARKQIDNGRHKQVAHWLEEIPEDILLRQPWLIYWLGMAHLCYDNHRARELFEHSYALFKKTGDVKGLYLSWCGVSDAYRFAHENFSGADKWIDELDWLQATHARPFDLELRGHLVVSVTGLLLWVRPWHPDLPQWIARLTRLFRHVPNIVIQVMCAGQLVFYYSYRGETEKLRDMGRRLRKLEKKSDDNSLFVSVAKALNCSIDWLTGDLKMCNDLIDEQLQLIRIRGIRVYSGLLLSQSLYHATCRRDLSRVEGLLEQYVEDISEQDMLAQCYFQLHSCNLQILREDYDLALTHSDLALELAEQSAVPFVKWFASAQEAYLRIEKGDYTQARYYLGLVRKIVEPMRSFSGIAQADMLESYLAYCQHDMEAALGFLATGFRRAREKDVKASGVWPPRMIATLCGLALEHEIETDFARRLIGLYRYRPQDSHHLSEHWPWPLKIHTLGRFSVLVDDQPLDCDSRPFDLLKVVLANGGKDVHEQTIMDTLWPDAEGDQAQSSFKTTLHRLRRILGGQPVLELKNRRLTLNGRLVWVDNWAVCRLLERVDDCVKNDDPMECHVLAQDVMRLYRGHFLPGEPEVWAIQQREKLRGCFVRCVMRLIRCVERGSPRKAIQSYRQLLEVDCLLEEGWQGLIRSQLAHGYPAEAQASYVTCARILSESLGREPSESTKRILAI